MNLRVFAKEFQRGQFDLTSLQCSEGSGNKSLVWQRYFLRTPNPRKKMQPHKV